MREITSSEINEISGGVCINPDIWHNIQNKALKDGFIFSGITITLSGAAVLGLTGSVAAAIGAGFIIAPYMAALGIYNSSAWDILNLG